MTAAAATHAHSATVEDLVRAIGKAQRALQMYLPNNPMYQRGAEQLAEAFGPVWQHSERIALDLTEDSITWNDTPVYQQPARGEGLAWQLYKDGLRQLVFARGAERDEVVRLLQVINRARMLPGDATDDLLTLLWEQEFAYISYAFVEVQGDGFDGVGEQLLAGGAGSGGEGRSGGNSREEVAEGHAAEAGSEHAAGGGHGVVDLGNFDATPYFLDEAELRSVHQDLVEEYRRDIRHAAMDALLDILESQTHPLVRREVIGLLEHVLPEQLAIGGFRTVAQLLRELRSIANRATDLDVDVRAALLSFEQRLSTADILDQLFRVLIDSPARPHDEDVGEVMRELQPSALPSLLAYASRIPDAGVRSVLEHSLESLARKHPEVLAEVLDHGASDAVAAAIDLAARLQLTQLVHPIAAHLVRGDDAIRLSAVRALGALGSPAAVNALEAAIDDADRGVRQAALAALLARGGSGGLIPRLEAIVFDTTERPIERSERRALFEAYGTLAGPAAVGRLQELIEPRSMFRKRVSPDIRASALYALGKIRTPDARNAITAYSVDKDAVVRAAANAVLRDWSA